MKNIVKEYQCRARSDRPIITSIVIMRTNNVYDMIERVNFRNIYNINEDIEILIVNDGSCTKDSIDIKNLCRKNNFSYLELDTKNEDFNASRARNMGAIHAKGEFILHEDIDLIGYPSFYEDIIKQIQIQGLYSDNKQILTIPVAYLSEVASKNFFNIESSIRKPFFIDSYLKGQSENFEFFMPASSLVVINRYYYLMIGGYNERFLNWGLEDLEFIYRCIKSIDKFILPDRDRALFTAPEFSKQLTYKGWRTMFRLHGDLLFQQGIIMFHIFHQKDKGWRNRDAHKNNLKLFNECTQRFDREGHYLPPLPFNLEDKALIFGKGCFAYNRALMPFFGEMVVKGYQNFDGSTDNNINILDYIKANNINRVIFTNPYANAQRQKIYSIIKNSDIPYYVVERGALRDSIFIDPYGFSCESKSYSECEWDKPLLEEERLSAIKYIKDEKSTEISLENQPKRIGVQELNFKLGLSTNQKVLFVPLQSRSDTTINYFSGDIKTYDNFINLVNEVSANLDKDWVVLVKTHPLSKIPEDIPNAIFVDDYNIKDLLDRSNAILLINSGVGVLGTLWEKPVLHCGQAFYRSNKLNRKVTNVSDVLQVLKSGFSPSREDVLKFTSYLINDFYSFGKMTTHTKDYTDNARLTITSAVDYYKINIDKKRYFNVDPVSQISIQAPIYDVFRSSIKPTNNKSKPKKSKIVNQEKEVADTKVKNNMLTERESPKIEIDKKLTSSIIRKTKKFVIKPKQSIKDIVRKRLL